MMPYTTVINKTMTGKANGTGRGGPSSEVKVITPDLADNWLGLNHDRQRLRRTRKVIEYAGDMKEGNWPVSTAMVAFDVRGRLINGQNVLAAVVLAGVPIDCVVLYNAPEKSMMVMDCGIKRTTDDHLKMAGKDYPRGVGATVRKLVMINKHEPMSDMEVQKFMETHDNAVLLAHRLLPGGRGVALFCSPATRALVARAHLVGVPERVLSRFCDVLLTGKTENKGEGAAVSLRNWMFTKYVRNSKGQSSERKKLYGMAETALANFVTRKDPQPLTPAETELFPLPWETESE